MIKELVQEEDIILINIHAPVQEHLNIYILTDIKGETDNNTIIVGEFNTPLTSTDRSFR